MNVIKRWSVHQAESLGQLRVRFWDDSLMIPSGFCTHSYDTKICKRQTSMCVSPVQQAVVPKRRDSSKNRNSHTRRDPMCEGYES